MAATLVPPFDDFCCVGPEEGAVKVDSDEVIPGFIGELAITFAYVLDDGGALLGAFVTSW